MDSVSSIMARGSALLRVRDDSISNGTTIDLLISLLVLVFVALILVGTLFMVRRIRRNRAVARQQLPTYNEPGSRPISNHRRLTITASPYKGARASTLYLYDEKDSMMNSPASPPMSPENVPEIRITFPDEHDESGRMQSGRVVVVRVGDTGVGLEPLQEEQLPAYEKESKERFHSIDMERIGGLKEKSEWS